MNDTRPLVPADELAASITYVRRQLVARTETAEHMDVVVAAAQHALKLEAAGRLALSALDALMGDSDLSEDDSPEMQACQALAALIPPTTSQHTESENATDGSEAGS